MLWNNEFQYQIDPFELEKDLEEAIVHVSIPLFGENRIYIDPKKKIGKKGGTRNIPDGYLLDLSSKKVPKLYVVENELAKHDPLKHIAVQILEFSLSFETSQHQVKNIVKNSLSKTNGSLAKCQKYAEENGFENVDYLLEEMIYGHDKFNALVIIDDLSEELEKVLISRFQFPVEILTLERYKSIDGKWLFKFEPFLSDISYSENVSTTTGNKSPLDPSDIDTIVVPCRGDGFQETFISENRWYAIRIHSSMISKIKYIASYQVAPESAITHIAQVASIEKWKDTNKYVVNFSNKASSIKPIKLVSKSAIKAPQAPRYTSYSRLTEAKNLDGAF